MMRKTFITFMSCILLLATMLGSAVAATLIVNQYPGDSFAAISVATWAAKNKVYTGGRDTSTNRMALMVSDVDSTGKHVFTANRWYKAHPNTQELNFDFYVYSVLVDTRHSKLFLGVSSTDPGLDGQALVMYSLDSNGEPTGNPTAYSAGGSAGISAIVIHPTLNKLYYCGWGSFDVYSQDLDTNGVPTGSYATQAIGAGGAIPYLAIRADGTRLYASTYPTVIYVMTLDANGNKTAVVTKTVSGNPADYPIISTSNRALYWKSLDGYLYRWQLTAAGDPTSTASKMTAWPIQACFGAPGSSTNVFLQQPVTYTDAVTGGTVTCGTRVREYTTTTNGTPSTILNDSGTIERKLFSNLNVTSTPVVNTTDMSGFLGNRIKNLSMRMTISSPVMGAAYKPNYSTSSFSTYADYPQISYSSRYNKVYVTSNTKLHVYNVATAAWTNYTVTNPSPVCLVDDLNGNGKIYIAQTNGNITAKALTTAGLPTGSWTTTTTGMTSIHAMTFLPSGTKRYVYLLGTGGTQGVIGTTNYIRLPGDGNYFSMGVTDTAKLRVYAVTQTNGNDNLYVWKLNSDGTILSGPTTYADGVTNYGLGTDCRGVAVNTALNRLYISGSPTTYQGANTATLAVYTLDANGDPSGAARAYTTPTNNGASGAIVLSNDKNTLYHGTWGDTALFRQPLNSSTGEPTGNSAWTTADLADLGSPLPYALTMTADGTKLISGFYPSMQAVVNLNTDGTFVAGPLTTLYLNGQVFDYGMLKPGTASSWINLNTALQNSWGANLGIVTFGGCVFTSANVTYEFSTNGGSTILPNPPVAQVWKGYLSNLYLPGYDITEAQNANLASWLMTSKMQFNAFHDTNTNPLVAWGCDRPEDYLVSSRVWITDNNIETLEIGPNILADTGVNCLGVTGSGVSGSDVYSAVTAEGITKFNGGGAYTPWRSFKWLTVSSPTLSEWATTQKDEDVNELGCTPGEVKLMAIADEPGWYYPYVVTHDPDNPNETFPHAGLNYSGNLSEFATYLQGKGVTLSDIGCSAWSGYPGVPTALHGICASDATTLQKRRLYYWTVRFMTESYSLAAAETTTALKNEFGSTVLTTVNLNNWPGQFYTPTYGTDIWAGGTTDLDDCALGSPDWFDLSRKNAMTCIWTEDWFSDWQANYMSMYGDLLRCAAREGTNIEYGSYVVGLKTGNDIKDGAKLKVMAMAGHGAKVLDQYTFGPDFADNSWAENPTAYNAYADAFRFLTRCEGILYPARPRTGTVAIVVPQASQIWDASYAATQYMYEVYGLYFALTHQQYPVDFIDQQDIIDGKLSTYGYSTLYVTEPNVSSAAQTAILNWVNSGHTLVLFPGACLFDEYNTACTTISSQIGASWATPVSRDGYISYQWSGPTTAITVTDTGTLIASSDVTPFQVSPLTVSSATSLASMPGGSAVTRKTYGSGRIFAYGYYPGNTYQQMIVGMPTNLPTGWRQDTRNIITAPARAGNPVAKRFANVSCDGIETALMENSTSGMAISMYNWTGQAATGSQTLYIQKASIPTALWNNINTAIGNGTLLVRSWATGANLTYANNANSIDVTVPSFDTVEVVTLTWATDSQAVVWNSTGEYATTSGIPIANEGSMLAKVNAPYGVNCSAIGASSAGGNCALAFKFPDNRKNVLVGLTDKTSIVDYTFYDNPSYKTVSIDCEGAGLSYVWESATSQTPSFSIQSGDKVAIYRSGSTFKLNVNGTDVYTFVTTYSGAVRPFAIITDENGEAKNCRVNLSSSTIPTLP